MSTGHIFYQENLIYAVSKSNGVVVTSYERMRRSDDVILDTAWHYVILDEGHKIRNPDSRTTVAVKRV